MNCTSIRKRLALHAGGDLDGREAAAVAAHLKSCLACYREYSEMHELLGQVRASGRHRARGDAETESLVAGVMRGIHGPPPPAPQLLPRLAMASGWAAALLLGVALGWRALVPADGSPIEPKSPARVLDHGSAPGALTIDRRDGSPAASLEEDLARQLEELRRRGGPSRSPQEPPTPALRVKSF